MSQANSLHTTEVTPATCPLAGTVLFDTSDEDQEGGRCHALQTATERLVVDPSKKGDPGNLVVVWRKRRGPLITRRPRLLPVAGNGRGMDSLAEMERRSCRHQSRRDASQGRPGFIGKDCLGASLCRTGSRASPKFADLPIGAHAQLQDERSNAFDVERSL